MSLSGTDWIKLNRLLDEALDLEPATRVRWMESLPTEYDSLRDTLRDLLLRSAGPETAEVLQRAPNFSAQFATPNSGDLIGPYRLIREIGTGGMATVWLAERADGSLQRKVALKLPRISLLDRDFAERMNRERDILASLEHPGIARLYDAGVDSEERPFLALEYVDGIPLDRYVAEHTLTIRERLRLFTQVAQAVAYAHARLIVHRDLKPTNILVKDDTVHLLDFGIAHLLQPGISLDSPDAWIGVRALTPRYAAPEQFEGQQPSTATDIYSLGVILYELLTGRTPYPHKTLPTGGEMLCLDPQPMLAIVDKRRARALRGDLDCIVRKALARDATQRYETVSAFVADIQRQQRNLPVLAQPDSTAYRARKFIRRYRVAVAFSSALLATIVAGAGVAFWQANAALRQRDHALRLYQEAQTTNELWNTVLTEGVALNEEVTIDDLLNRGEAFAERAFAATPSQYSVAMDSLATMYQSYGKDVKAHTLTEKGLRRIEQFDASSPQAASLQCSYAVAMAAVGKSAEADAMIVRTMARIEGETDLQQYCLQMRYLVASANNDTANALKYIQQSYELSQQFPTQSLPRATALLAGVATANSMAGNFSESQRFYEKAIELLQASGRADSRSAASIYLGWGQLATNTGDPLFALDRYERVIAIEKRLAPGRELSTSLLGRRANTLAQLGRLDEALSDYEQMREYSVEKWSDDAFVYGTAGIADIRLLQRNIKAARAEIDLIDQRSEIKLPERGAAALRLMILKGQVLMEEGQLDAAHAALTAATAQFDTSSVVVAGRTKVHIAHAEVLRRMSRLDAALEEARYAIDIATKARTEKPSNQLGLAELIHAEILIQRNDRAAAKNALAIAIENLRGALGELHPDTVRAQELLRGLSTA